MCSGYSLGRLERKYSKEMLPLTPNWLAFIWQKSEGELVNLPNMLHGVFPPWFLRSLCPLLCRKVPPLPAGIAGCTLGAAMMPPGVTALVLSCSHSSPSVSDPAAFPATPWALIHMLWTGGAGLVVL